MTKTENRKTFLHRLDGRFSQEDINLIEFAYDLSKEAHRTQKRDRGGRYFEHPRAGCLIMMDELGLYNKDLIISFLFHDVGEDTPLIGNRIDSYEDFVIKAKFRLNLMFGDKVADTIIRLTKPEIDQIKFFTKEECLHYYEKELAKSNEAIFGKELDRLHNLRTVIGSRWKTSKTEKLIVETESVYLPIFNSVSGPLKDYSEVLISKIKTELKALKASI
jgi:(p)ppGpp synthase/HD superfamily hydrolase